MIDFVQRRKMNLKFANVRKIALSYSHVQEKIPVPSEECGVTSIFYTGKLSSRALEAIDKINGLLS